MPETGYFLQVPLFGFDAEPLNDLAGRDKLVVEKSLRARRRHSIADADIEAEAGSPLAHVGRFQGTRDLGARMMSIAKAYPARKVGAEHSQILQAVLAKDSEQAVLLLQQHYRRTAAVLYSDLDGLLA